MLCQTLLEDSYLHEVDKPVIEDNRDGTVCVRYEPREEGLHELVVKYNGEHVQG
jgi:filamin